MPGHVQTREDIMETRRGEGALTTDIEVFRDIFESSPDTIVITDAEYCVLYWNQSAKKLFGYDAWEIMNRSAKILIPECHRMSDRYNRTLFLETGQAPFMSQALEAQAL